MAQSATSVASSQKVPSSHSPSLVNGQASSVALAAAAMTSPVSPSPAVGADTGTGSARSWATPHSRSRRTNAPSRSDPARMSARRVGRPRPHEAMAIVADFFQARRRK